MYELPFKRTKLLKKLIKIHENIFKKNMLISLYSSSAKSVYSKIIVLRNNSSLH